MVLGQLPPKKIPLNLILTLTLNRTLTLTGGQLSGHQCDNYLRGFILRQLKSLNQVGVILQYCFDPPLTVSCITIALFH